MPLDTSVKKVLVIGSGPVVIGQAAEFDYAAVQACRVLKEEGVRIVLVNSNPASVTTDDYIADRIYIEPLTPATIKRIIKKERPDSILTVLGGQIGVSLCKQLVKEDILDEMSVRLLGSMPDIIDKAGRYQISPEKSVAGWKQVEFEIVRDREDNAVIVCAMEGFDPVGLHTGDSILVTPIMTLNDKELQLLRTAALDIVRALGVEGCCNIRFALHPYSTEYDVVEVRVGISRSSAFAGRATGCPVAKVATKIALGYTLDEIEYTAQGKADTTFEPKPGHVAVRLPKWPFDKLVYANRELGTQMKATGEVVALARTFEECILKAVRGAGLGLTTLEHPRIAKKADTDLRAMLSTVTDERLFVLYQAIKRGFNIDDLYAQTRVDKLFLRCLRNIADADVESERQAFRLGEAPLRQPESSKLAYNSEADENTERWEIKGGVKSWTPLRETGGAGGSGAPAPGGKDDKPRVVVLGSGPLQIGQGIESDYACVHCVMALAEMGFEAIVINNNPEAVSTDCDIEGKLYFEPVCIDDVMRVIEEEKPVGVITTYGGETAHKLTKMLASNGVRIIGTSPESIDVCKNRVPFHSMLERLGVKYPGGYSVVTEEEALDAAEKLGYPVIMKLSNMPGSRNKIIAYSRQDICDYIEVILRSRKTYSVLIDKYLEGRKFEIDAISDGTDVFIPGLMEHVERTGIHSGGGISVYPAIESDYALSEKILSTTQKLCTELGVKGLVNIQYIYYEEDIYVIKVRLRTSQSVPHISKVTGIPVCEISTKVSLGMKLTDMGYATGFGDIPPYIAARVPVFTFEKLDDLDMPVGPEMKSTGNAFGIGKNLEEALCKGLAAAGYTGERKGGILITVRDSDKEEILGAADKLWRCGFALYATRGTAKFLSKRGYRIKAVEKIHENPANNTETLIESGCVNYIISISESGRNPAVDDAKLRRKACTLDIPCLTSVETANALAEVLFSGYSELNTQLVEAAALKSRSTGLPFTKMHGCGNDYIYINCFDMEISLPESLAVILSDRNKGIGGDGIVLIMRSEEADARMRMFNIDGSEGSMCGNAIRCVGKYLYDNGMVKRLNMSIETKSGIKELYLSTRNEKVSTVKVDMGCAELRPSNIPVNLRGKKVVAKPVTIAGTEYEITCVSMGNPHAVVFVENVDSLDLETIGPLFENNELFPDRVNAEFVEITERNRLKVRVWERGSGITQACGTGACAAAVAAVLNEHCDMGADIRVELPGGELIINYTKETVMMTGEAVTVFEGVVEI